jgi:hypothetical protein
VRRLVLAAAAGVSPYLVHLAMAGPANVVRGMVLEPVLELRAGRRLPLPPSWDDFDGFLQRAGLLDEPPWPLPSLRGPVQLNLWLLATLVATVVVLVAGWRAARAWRPRLLVIAVFTAGLLPQALQRADSTHLAWVSCVTFAVLPVALVELCRPGSLARPARVLGAALVPVVLLVGVLPDFTVRAYADAVAQTFGHRRKAEVMEWEGRTFRYARADAVDAVNALLPRVEAVTEPGDRLFVGPGDLRKTPYSEAFLYHLLPDLVPATRFIEMDPGIANAPGSGMVDELRSADVVILSSIRDDWNEPNDSLRFGPDEPNEVLEREFCLIESFGDGSLRPRPLRGLGDRAERGFVWRRANAGRPADLRRGREHRGGADAHPRRGARRRRAGGRRQQPRRHRGAGPGGGREIPRVDVEVRERKDGLGNAYRHGFRIGMDRGYEVLMQMDADLSHDAASIPALLAAVDAGAEAVIGSRYVPGGAIPHWPWYRRALSRYGNLYACFALRMTVHDATSGFRAYRTEALVRPSTSSGPAPTATASRSRPPTGCRARAARLAEVPIVFTDRVRGYSKMSLSVMAEEMWLVTWWGVPTGSARSPGASAPGPDAAQPERATSRIDRPAGRSNRGAAEALHGRRASQGPVRTGCPMLASSAEPRSNRPIGVRRTTSAGGTSQECTWVQRTTSRPAAWAAARRPARS